MSGGRESRRGGERGGGETGERRKKIVRSNKVFSSLFDILHGRDMPRERVKRNEVTD